MKKIVMFFIIFLLIFFFNLQCNPPGSSSGGDGDSTSSSSSSSSSSLSSSSSSSSSLINTTRIIDHASINIDSIPVTAINNAKNSLHIAYGHTSHGSQIITGMDDLDAFKGGTGLYAWNDGLLAGHLDIDDNFVGGDLGDPDRTTWAQRTRDYLNDPANADVNVVIWSWCGQTDTSEENINTYLNLMNQLETDFPHVIFVYMTGHLNGGGLTGNLYLRNEQIREFCRNNNKWLFDFADIESFDPDGLVNYNELLANDNCDYDSDGDGSVDLNWAIEWQNNHPGEWYSCSAAHSQPLNGNLKAYAAWWLWARIAGWDGNP